jgi:hypothetical protein
MSITILILLNIGVALMLVVVLAAAMLAPGWLRRPFAEGHTHRQRAALRKKHRAEVAQLRRAHRRGHRDPQQLRPIRDV